MNTAEVLLAVGERIRNARRRANLTQTELAQKAGYSKNGIAMIERGESDPKFSGLINIAEALQVDISYLTTGRALDGEQDQRVESHVTAIDNLLAKYLADRILSDPDLRELRESVAKVVVKPNARRKKVTKK